MPKVGNKTFPYTKEGRKEAKQVAKKTGGKVQHWSQGLKPKKK